MSQRWDSRYKDAALPGKPCSLLVDKAHLLPNSGQALDLACGLGGNALLLQQTGLDTHAWDSSAVAINHLNQYGQENAIAWHTQCRDVSLQPPTPASFDVIVVSYFLERALCPALAQALKPGGLLFYQTFTRAKCSEKGPSNPDYLLAKNELILLFSNLDLVYYREDAHFGDLEQGDRNTARLIATRP